MDKECHPLYFNWSLPLKVLFFVLPYEGSGCFPLCHVPMVFEVHVTILLFVYAFMEKRCVIRFRNDYLVIRNLPGNLKDYLHSRLPDVSVPGTFFINTSRGCGILTSTT